MESGGIRMGPVGLMLRRVTHHAASTELLGAWRLTFQHVKDSVAVLDWILPVSGCSRSL